MSAPHPSPRRTPDGRVLASRHVIAYCTGRHVDVVRKRVPAVACDLATRVVLLDLDEASRVLGGVAQRHTGRVY